MNKFLGLAFLVTSESAWPYERFRKGLVIYHLCATYVYMCMYVGRYESRYLVDNASAFATPGGDIRWNFSEFFVVKESLALMYKELKLPSEALLKYQVGVQTVTVVVREWLKFTNRNISYKRQRFFVAFPLLQPLAWNMNRTIASYVCYALMEESTGPFGLNWKITRDELIYIYIYINTRWYDFIEGERKTG